MAPTIGQMLAVSFTEVVNRARKPENQWVQNAFLDELESQGAIEHKNFGPTLEATLDYQRNQGTAWLSSDLQPVVMTKTEVIQAASWGFGQLSVPMFWAKADEVITPTKNEKVPFVASLIANGVNSHDDAIEQAFFVTSTNGFYGLPTHITTAGTGTDGGIDASTNLFWRNQQATYLDETDILSASTTVYNACAKGTGAKLFPTLVVSDSTTQALFESTQMPLQRWEKGEDASAGFKKMYFKTAKWMFSPFGTTTAYFLNNKNFRVIVSKQYFRDREETMPLENAHGFVSKIYSALQTITDNRSRLGCIHL